MGSGSSNHVTEYDRSLTATTDGSFLKKVKSSKSTRSTQDMSPSYDNQSIAMKTALKMITSYDEETIFRRTAIHMLFHHYDSDESREFSSTELVQLMLELIRSAPSSTQKERDEATASASILLQFLDSDGDTILEEQEFVDFILKHDSIQYQEYASQGSAQRILVQFLIQFSKRIMLVETALNMIFDKKGRMDQNRFVSLLVAGSHATKGSYGRSGRKGSGFAWGADRKLWFSATTIINAKEQKGSGRDVSKYLWKNNIFTFLLSGFLVNCEEAKLQRHKNNQCVTQIPAGKGRVQIRLREILEGCILVRLLPIMERAEIEADEDYVRRLSVSHWFDELSPPTQRVAMGEQEHEMDGHMVSDMVHGNLESGILEAHALKQIFHQVFCQIFSKIPQQGEVESAYSLVDVDGNGMVSKDEFLTFVNRLLLTRHTCTSHIKTRSRDLSHRIRRSLLLEAERRMELVYQYRSVLKALFRRYSIIRDATTEKLLDVPLLNEIQAALLFDELGDGRGTTCEKQGTALSRELFQWCWPLYQDPPPSFDERNFVSHGIELLLSQDPTFHTEIARFLKLKLKKELKRRQDHSQMGLRAIFRAACVTEKDRLTHACFDTLMQQHSVSFRKEEIADLFDFMNDGRKKRQRITDTASPKRQSRVKEKAFVRYLSRGLRLSYEHRVIFAQRSLIHQKVHTFLISVEKIEKEREIKLDRVFDRVDGDGSGMIHATALHEIMASLLSEQENLDDGPTLEEVAKFMECLDDNRDDWLKRSEFTDFFVDAVVRLEAEENESWLSVIPMEEIDVRRKVKRFANALLIGLKDATGESLRPKRQVVRLQHEMKEEKIDAIVDNRGDEGDKGDKDDKDDKDDKGDGTTTLPEIESGGADFFNLDDFTISDGKAVEPRQAATTIDTHNANASGESDSDSDDDLLLLEDSEDEDERDEGESMGKVKVNVNEDDDHEIEFELSDVEEHLGFDLGEFDMEGDDSASDGEEAAVILADTSSDEDG